MNEIILWAQSNWYEAGILLIASAFLFTGVWFARNVLKTARVFQDQMGALLKLSITSGPPEAPATTARTKSSLAEASPYWLTPTSQTPVDAPAEPLESEPRRFVVAWHRVVLWLNEPMATSGTGGWRRAVNWLQAPANH